MDMTNITKIPLRTLLEDIGFEADNDEETVYELAINIENQDKNKYSGLKITVSLDYKLPKNKFKSNKNKDDSNNDSYIRIFCWLTTYDDKLGKFIKNHTDTLYTKDNKEVVKFLEEYIGEIKKRER